MQQQQPSAGRIVHYVSRGSADGVFPPACRAAVVTEVYTGSPAAGLAVLNPSGLFFDQMVPYDEDDKTPGTWHFPERV